MSERLKSNERIRRVINRRSVLGTATAMALAVSGCRSGEKEGGCQEDKQTIKIGGPSSVYPDNAHNNNLAYRVHSRIKTIKLKKRAKAARVTILKFEQVSNLPGLAAQPKKGRKDGDDQDLKNYPDTRPRFIRLKEGTDLPSDEVHFNEPPKEPELSITFQVIGISTNEVNIQKNTCPVEPKPR